MSVLKWTIYKANLDPVIGSEQGRTRPVLVISENVINQYLNVVNVLPLTSKKENRTIYPNEVLLSNFTVLGLKKESILLCHQIRSLDKKRLIHPYGSIEDEETRNMIMEALCFQLGIRRN